MIQDRVFAAAQRAVLQQQQQEQGGAADALQLVEWTEFYNTVCVYVWGGVVYVYVCG